MGDGAAFLSSGSLRLSADAVAQRFGTNCYDTGARHFLRQGNPVRSWRWSSTQLEPGELRIDSAALHAGPVLFGAASINRVSLHRLRAPADSISLLTRLRDAGALLVCGHEITRDRFLRIEPDTEVELIAHRGGACLLISIHQSRLGGGLASPQRPGHGPLPHVNFLACPVDAGSVLEEQVRAALQGTRSAREGAASERAHQIAATLLSRPAEPALNPAPVSVARLGRARRRAAVELARQYIRKHLTEPLQLADLCSNTHLQARSLEYGFQEVVRLSPMRYVKMLRLGEVRGQLLNDVAGLRSISEIALDAGFSHLSQFAVDYRNVFAETPSATRRRAQIASAMSARFE